jgi:hypothetical protein
MLKCLVNTKSCKSNIVKNFWSWSLRFPDCKSWPISTLCFMQEMVSSKTKKSKESLEQVLGLCCFEGIDVFL